MSRSLAKLVGELDDKPLEKYRFDTEMFAVLAEIQKQVSYSEEFSKKFAKIRQIRVHPRSIFL